MTPPPARYFATVQWLCPHAGILRLHPGPAARVGDPFVWSCVVEARDGADGREAWLWGVDEPLPLGGAAAVKLKLWARGFLWRCYERPRGVVRKSNEPRRPAP